MTSLVAHGGVAGAVVEGLMALAVVSVLVAVWLRERRAHRDRSPYEGSGFRDDDEGTPS